MARMNWVDKLIVAAILILLAVVLQGKSKAANEMIFEDRNGNSMLLLETPCKQGPFLTRWLQGVMIWEGKRLKACWRIQTGQVAVLDEEGDVTSIPMTAFKRKEAI